MLFYKLTDMNWYHQFLSGNLKDKDYFTKLVKWLMNLTENKTFSIMIGIWQKYQNKNNITYNV
jgi:hypothetical protein